ncbi:uncharacterized protein LOC135334596 isoform X5 [Halichondria panicea]|uniref:uncharacterized protein LOC135334596 isoform X5 n=1 Tax=Halichondria panicea TaxID=6063 RepID=UPI00312B4CDF
MWHSSCAKLSVLVILRLFSGITGQVLPVVTPSEQFVQNGGGPLTVSCNTASLATEDQVQWIKLNSADLEAFQMASSTECVSAMSSGSGDGDKGSSGSGSGTGTGSPPNSSGFGTSLGSSSRSGSMLGSGSGSVTNSTASPVLPSFLANGSVVTMGSNLTFNSTHFGDEGYYVCVVSLPDRICYSENFSLTVSPGDLSVNATPFNVVNFNEDVNLTCSARGGPNNVYQWLRNGMNTTIRSQPTLSLSLVDASDGGEYTCVVSNAAGISNASLTLYIRPYIVTHPQQILATVPESVSFTCKALGFPAPNYRWDKIGDPGFKRFTQNLTFNPVNFGNEGLYQCVVSIMVDMINYTAESNQGELIFSPGDLSVNATPFNVVNFDKDVNLTCSARGGPNNVYQWLRNGMNTTVGSQPTLSLSLVDASDGGEYTCVVSNAAGISNASLTLYIRPYIVTHPQQILATVPESVSFTCKALGFPALNYRWDKIGDPGFKRFTQNLTFNPVNFGNEGLYQCVVSIMVDMINYTAKSNQGELILTPGEVMIDASPSNVGVLNENVTLNCSASGGTDNLQWQRNGINLPGEMQSTLLLTSVNASDGGEYTCVVGNAAGNGSTNFTLYIHPYFVTNPQRQLLRTVASSATFTCEASAFPAPDYRWDKIGDVGFDNLDRFRQNFSFNPIAFGNEGNYVCVASIIVDNINYTAESKPGELILSPETSVSVTPSMSRTVQRDTQTFTCSAMGGPGNMFSWRRLYDNEIVGDMSNLTVNVSGATDGGQYKCEVTNIAGSDSDNTTVYVGPIIDTPPLSKNVSISESSTFTCSASGFPVPTIIWVHNGTQNRDDENRTTVLCTMGDRSVTSTLTINMAMVNDSGEYVCNASSPNYDTVSTDPVILLVQATPERPQNVTAVEVTTNSVILEWVEPHDNNAPIRDYKVSYTRPSFLGGTAMTINSTVETVNITGLHPGAAYVFKVVAFNDIGESPSGNVMVTTVKTVPTNPPENVMITVLSFTEIQVNWTEVPMVHRNGIITTYEVMYEPLMTFDILTAARVNTTNVSTVLTGLEENLEYNVSVRAYTSVGPGPYSPEDMEITFEDAPASPPQNVTATVLSSTEIQVNWTEVAEIDQNGIITEYEVMYEPLMTFGVLNRTTIRTMKLFTVLYELEEYVEYNISVRAYTYVGPGPYSVGIINITFEDLPSSSPNNVSATAVSSTEISVMWQEVAAIDRNGNITQYEITYNGEFEQSNVTDGNARSFIITGLDEFANYSISVRAYTSVGPGPYSPFALETIHGDISPGDLSVNATPFNVVNFDKDVNLTCSARGGPNNVYQWLRNGMNTTIGSQPTLSLSLVDASDGGEYTCVVSNAAGISNASLTLYIQPYIVSHPQQILATVPGSVSFTCEALGFPAPNYRWDKIGDPEFKRFTQNLTFNPVNFGNEGLYQCVASIMVDMINYTAKSNQGELILTPGEVMIDASPSNVGVLNENVTLNCSTSGGTDNLQWQRNGINLPGEMQSTLLLTSVNASDGGEYTCVVGNAAGNGSTNFTLYIHPYFVTNPQRQLLRTVASSATFTCEASAFPAPDYRWDKIGDVGFDNLDRFRQNFSFNPIAFGNEGNYVCVASIIVDNINYTAESKPGELILSPETSVSVTPSMSRTVQRDTQTFTCSAMGGPGNMFSWRKLYDNEIVGDMSNLTVNVSGATDGGQYKCEVTNIAGSDSDNTTVYVGPIIDTPPLSKNVSISESSTFTCSASGFPVPTIIWVHNGTQNRDDENRTTVLCTMGDRSVTSTLTINMAMVNDSGEYVCNASSPNYDTVSTDPVILLVQATPERPQNVTAVEVTTNSVILEWVEPHDNNAPIRDYKVSYTRPSFLGGTAMTINSTVETVNITGLHPGAAYVFKVVAFNDIGESPSGNVMVTTVKTVPTNPPENVMITVLSSTEIQVNWTEVPMMHRNGIITTYEVMYEPLMTFDILTAARVNTTNVSTVLTGLEENLEYNVSVRAYTSVGPGPYSPEDMEITFEDAPASPPQNVTATVLSSTEIQVNWTEVAEIDQNGIITEYEVMYEPLMTFGVLNRTTIRTMKLFTVLYELEEYVEYNISVRAYTYVGPGPYSVGIINITFEDLPSSSPNNVSATAVSSTEISVMWQEVAAIDRNGNITQYEITYNGEFEQSNVTDGNARSFIITGLDEFANYSISVRAYTSVGPGPYSPFALETIHGDISPGDLSVNATPFNVVNFDKDVNLTCSARGGPNNVYQWLRNGMNTTIGSQPTLSLSLVDASDGGEYTCVVSNAAGISNASLTLYIQPYIVSHPQQILATVPGSVSFTCEALGFPAPNYRWDKIGDPEFKRFTQNLTFNPVNFGNEGLYQCVASIMVDMINYTAKSNQGELILTPGEVMIDASPSNVGVLNENVTLNCSASGGIDNLQWQRNGINLPREMQSTLLLTSVNASDGGEYTCVVGNAAGNGSTNFTLYIHPYIVANPQRQLLRTVASSATFTCEASAFPAPDYRWDKVGDVGFDNLDRFRQNFSFNPIAFGNEGNYICVASIIVDNINYTAESKPGELILSPETSVSITPSMSRTVQGDTQKFTCSAMGGPGNIFSWRRLYDNKIVGDMSNLAVNVSGATDGGQYKCEVTNIAGSDSDNTTVYVGPIINTPPLSVNVSISELSTFTCLASGFPVPTIIWVHNGTQNRDDENRTTVLCTMGDRSVTSTLTINMAMVNDSGEYVCNASSPNYDTVSTDPVILLVQATPERPQNVTAVEVTTTSVILEWVEPHDNNAPIRGYKVSYTRPSFLGGTAMTINSTVETVTITGLHPGAAYVFKVVAFNDIGESPSDNVMVTTVETVPTNPPENVMITVLSSTEIQVNWTEVPMMHRNGIITTYEVMYEPLMTFDVLTAARVNITNVSSVLTGLEENLEYNVSVRAYTSVGPGPYSPEDMEITFKDAPASPPQNVTATVLSSTEIQVNWTEVSEIYQNGIITEYDVMYEPLMTFGVLNRTTIRTMNLFTVLYELEEYVEYNISVRAYTCVGPGPYSVGTMNITFEDVPSSSPSNVSATAVSSTEISVMWQEVAAIDQNGNITQYEITYNREFENQSNFTDGNARSFIITGLDEFANYSISVRAYTSVGPGPYSPIAVEATDEDTPASPPQNVMTTVLSSTEILVNWTEVPEIDQNGLIVTYEVMYDPLMTFNGMLSRITVNTTNLSITLNNLQEYVEYNISVRAYTNVGPGPYSVGIINRTLENAPSGSPTIDNVMSLSPTEIQVTWIAIPEIEQNGVITRYEVLYRSTLDFTIGSVSTMDGDTFTANITELEESVVYNITVRAYTVVGPGPFSEVAMERTGGAAPASPPQNVTATVLSSTEIQVNWTEVAEIDQSGIITQYEVMYEPLMTFGVLNTATIRMMNLFTVLFGLEEYVEYNISVRAYTNDGAGPYSVGVVRRTFEDVPSSPPNDVNTISVSSTVIGVTWEEVSGIDQNGNITMYEVMYNGEFDLMNQSNFADGNIQNFTITGLDEFSDYNISVRAYTSVGPGPYSRAEMEMTKEDVPTSPTQNVTASVLSSTEIQVNWTEIPEIEQNGIIIEYEVMYEPQMTFNDMLTTTAVNTTNMFVTLTGLQEYVVYNISVRAYTNVGPGPFSVEIDRETLEDVPGSSPRNLQVIATGPTSLNVSWEPPVEMDINGVLTNYTIEYYITKEENSPHDVVVVSSATFTILLENLNFTIYNVSVSANTVIGRGPITERTQRTDENVPGEAPQNIAVNSESSTSIRVEWDPPREDFQFGIIRSYIVLYRVTETGSAMVMNVVNRSLIIESLMEFTNYSVEVAAVTVGEGPYSDPVTVVTDQDIPGVVARPPDNQSVLSPFSANVSWTPPVDPNGIITQYTVNYFIVSNDTMSTRRRRQAPVPTVIDPVCVVGGMENINRNINVTGERTFAILENLTPYSVYEFRVQAETSIGPGNFSLPRLFSTPEHLPTEPRSLSVQTLSSTSFEVTWESPRCNFGDRTGYNVSHDPILGNFDPLGTVGTLSNPFIQSDSNAGSVIITGLSPFTDYTVSICALTSAGCGNISSNTAQTNEDAPEPVSSLDITSTRRDGSSNRITIMVTWMRPSERNGPYRYMLNYTAEQSSPYPVTRGISTASSSINLAGDSQSYSVPIIDSVPFADFTVSLYAYNIGRGVGFRSTVMFLTEKTTSIEPTSVLNLVGTTTSHQSFLVNWDVPQFPNSEIINYIIYYTIASAIQNFPINDSGYTFVNQITDTTYDVMNLDPFTNYTVHVRAIGNPNLQGSVVEEILVRTNITNPSAVVNLTVEANLSTEIIVTWNPPTKPNGPISHYVVYYTKGSTPQTGTISSSGYAQLTTTGTMVSIRQLDPFTYYQIHVQPFVTEIPYVLEGTIGTEIVMRTFSASCPVLILINGMIMYSSAAIPPLEGTVAIHVCDEGYVLLGGTTKTCQSNGTWSGGEIACNLLSCGPPPSIPNGIPDNPTSTIVGVTVRYSCHAGFIHLGSMITCLTTGSWSELPSCQVPPPVYLSLSSTNYLTGLTEIDISSVRENNLVCHTDLAACCRQLDSGVDGGMGQWYYPNGSSIGEGELRVSRGQMTVSLSAMTSAQAPSGLYCCVVLTSVGVLASCVHIVSSVSIPSTDCTGAVIGATVISILALLIIVTCVIVATYLVRKHKRVGAMSVRNDIPGLTYQSSVPTYDTISVTYEEIPIPIVKNVRGNYDCTQNEAYETTDFSESGNGNTEVNRTDPEEIYDNLA